MRILILHSKIDAKMQEEEMLKFENKEYDLLLSTSIVESGIDLPNANTIIVEKAIVLAWLICINCVGV